MLQFKQDMAKEAGEATDSKMDADAQRIAQDFLVLECHVESSFSDASIAYDVVGFRGMGRGLSAPARRAQGTARAGGYRPPRRRGHQRRPQGIPPHQPACLSAPRSVVWWRNARSRGPGGQTRARWVCVALLLRVAGDPRKRGPAKRWSPAMEDAKKAVIMGYKQFMDAVRRLAHLVGLRAGRVPFRESLRKRSL